MLNTVCTIVDALQNILFIIPNSSPQHNEPSAFKNTIFQTRNVRFREFNNWPTAHI